MKHIILAPDSFKGTMSAEEVCCLQKEVILEYIPDAEIWCIPMADGGEGFTDAVLRICGGERVVLSVTGPLNEPVESFYGILPDGTAVIEMAAAAGLMLMQGERDPLNASTYGVGELIRHASEQGASRILLGLGGSATNDGGIGMAAALGYSFFNADDDRLEPLARNLANIARICPPKKPIKADVIAACDVNNPLCGSNGATGVFGPQKGVTKDNFKVLEQGLLHLGHIMTCTAKTPIPTVPGAGAGGGMGAGVLFFLHGCLKTGVELLLDISGFDKLLDNADFVITGEGCMDAQSLHGKVPAGVGLHCKRKGVPCIAVCGSLGTGAEKLYEYGIDAMFSTVHHVADFSTVRISCKEDMKILMRALMRVLSNVML